MRDSYGSLDRVEIFEYWNAGVPTDRVRYLDDLVMAMSPQNVDADGLTFIAGPL